MSNFFSDYFNTRYAPRRSMFDQYAIDKYGYDKAAPGSAAEFEAFDRADFDDLSAGGLARPELSFGEKLGLGMGQGGHQKWMQMGMGQSQPQALQDPMGQIRGLMSMAGAGGQRPYTAEVAPAAPMPDYVQRLLQRGLMG